jgi:hypothetical protein
MKTHKPAQSSRAYTDFIAERDHALERLFVRANQEANDYLRKAMSRAVEIVAYRYAQLSAGEMWTLSGKRALAQVDADLALEFGLAARHVAIVIQELSAQAYTLSLVGEAEAIGRALKQPAKYNVPCGTSEVIAAEDMLGESVEGRVALAFSRIRRDIMDALELARVKDETTEEMLARVKAAMPKPRIVKRPPKRLAKVQEADRVDEPFSFGFVSDQEWSKIVANYLNDYIPKWRGPDTVFDIEVEALGDEWYGWEIEQYLANEFVSKVRNGQDATAKQNGIADMVWIAVLDDKTDECCAWRDGLTSSEIEKELERGKHKNEECDSIVPPAHFNCRCTMAPLLDVQLAGEEFEKPASNAQEFETWLNT